MIFAGKGPISYAFASAGIMQQSLESALLKIIQASDENDMSQGWQEDISGKRELRRMISDLKMEKDNLSKPPRKRKYMDPKGFK